jgi:putative transposase
MPRTARASVGGVCYHVCNRGNARARVFHGPRDYEDFCELLGRGAPHTPMRILGFCLMPNHFHLVLWPRDDGDLSRYMQWLLTAQVRRHRRRHRGSGHVWQGRFSAFPIQRDRHLLTVLRYVERNPLRARLVERAERWRWSSLAFRAQGAAWLAEPPVELPRGWPQRVNRAETAAELRRLRRSVQRGTPFGTAAWMLRTAARLGLESSLRPRGRPRLSAE